VVDAGVAVTAVPTGVGVEVGTTATASQHHDTITVTPPPVHQQGSKAIDQGRRGEGNMSTRGGRGRRGEAVGGARGRSMPVT
jgi:hypothetical protein